MNHLNIGARFAVLRTLQGLKIATMTHRRKTANWATAELFLASEDRYSIVAIFSKSIQNDQAVQARRRAIYYFDILHLFWLLKICEVNKFVDFKKPKKSFN